MADSSLRSTVPRYNLIQLRVADVHEQAAIRYLARRDRTEAQLRTYLERMEAPPVRIRAVIARFKKLGYLNDQAFAQRWARGRMARLPMGRERLEHELRAQGLEERTIADTIEEIYGDTTERELARKLVETRAATPAFLRRRGFSEETIEALFSQMTIEPSAFSGQLENRS